ncbi:MAG TPA: VWA domain-containing protein [Pyrinomonadaceae bacterium]|jgi:VWFA-related protein
MKRNSSPALILLLSLVVNTLGQSPTQTPAATPQQDKPDQDEVVRITTNLVQVDVTVMDKNGRQVTDLRPEEIEILEDGRPQKITNFSYVSLGNAEDSQPLAAKSPAATDKTTPVPPSRLRPEDVRRTVALVVDDLSLSFESTHFMRQALRKFVDQQMQPGDLVAIIRTGGGIGALQEFTSDKRQLYAAIERVKFNLQGRGGVGAFAPIEGDQIAAARPESPVGVDNREEEDERRTVDARSAADELNDFREDIFSIGTLGAVNYIVRGMKELPGRKSILLLSEGFSLSDPERDNSRFLEALRRLIDQANRASVVIYTLDARGLQTLGLTAADNVAALTPDELETSLSDRRSKLFDTQSGLNYLAQQTGGFAIRNTNDLSGGIKRVLDDQKGYYLIGYRPDESTFDEKGARRRFHKLKVNIKRPGLSHRTRTGFYGVTDEDAAPVRRTRSEQLAGAITSPFNSSGVGVRLTSLFANDPKVGSFVRSIMHINVSDLTFTEEADGWHKTIFDVLALTFGDNGVVIDESNRTQTIRMRGETYKRALQNGLVYQMAVPVKKPGAYQLRAALRDVVTERVGSASQFIEVPDIGKNRLTVSGIVIQGFDTAAARNAATQSTQAEAAAGPTNAARDAQDLTDIVDPQASPALRRFRHGMVLQYAYVIYNAKLAPAPQLTTQMRLFRDGKPIFTGKVMPLSLAGQKDLKRINGGGLLQLGTDMTPGEYVLQVIVTDALAKEKYRTATQWMDFEIVK